MKNLDFDWKPLLLVPVLALSVLPFIGSPSTWLTLTVAGLAMGMIIFIIASGLTLVFGLMDVLNFGHGVFIALGAFVATTVLGLMGDWTGSPELWRNLVAIFPANLQMLSTGFPGADLPAWVLWVRLPPAVRRRRALPRVTRAWSSSRRPAFSSSEPSARSKPRRRAESSCRKRTTTCF
mgnify:CR=1 FL=1